MTNDPITSLTVMLSPPVYLSIHRYRRCLSVSSPARRMEWEWMRRVARGERRTLSRITSLHLTVFHFFFHLTTSDTSGDGKVSRGTESGKHRDNKRISKRFLHLVTVNLSLSHARYSRLSFILFRSRRRVNDRRRAWGEVNSFHRALTQLTASSLGSIVRLLPFPPYPRLARLGSSFSLFTRLIPRGTRKEWKGDRSEPDTTLRGTQGKDETSTGTHETKPDKSMRWKK